MPPSPGRRRRWNWIRPFEVLALLGLSLGVHLVIALVLALTPSGYQQLAEPGESATLLERNSVIDFLSTNYWTLGMALVWSGLCGFLAWLQRRQEERYDGLALLACAFVFPGAQFAIVGCNIAGSFVDYRPIGVLRVALVLMSVSALFGLLSLVRLVVSRSPRRGRLLALFCVAWCSVFGWVVGTFVLYPRCVDPLPPGWELPIAKVAWPSTSFIPNPFDPPPRPEFVIVSVDHEGLVRVNGEVIEMSSPGSAEDELRAALAGTAEGLAYEGGYCEAPLHLFVDARAPCSSVVPVLEICDEEELRIWKIIVAVSRQPFAQEGTCTAHRLPIYATRIEPRRPDALGVVEVMPDDSGPSPDGVRYRCGELETSDPREILRLWWGRNQRDRTDFPAPVIAVAPELPWDGALQAAVRLRAGHEVHPDVDSVDLRPLAYTARFELLKE